MAIIQEGNAVFYHPLDNVIETLKTLTWTGPSEFDTGKVSNALKQASGSSIDGYAQAGSAGGVNLFPEVAALSATKFIIIYKDQDDSNRGVAVVATVPAPPTPISFGTPVSYTTALVLDPAIVALDASNFVVAFEQPNNTVRVGTVIGASTIAFGSNVSIGSGRENFALTAFSSTKFAVAYNDVGRGKAQVGVVSGLNISLGATTEFKAGALGGFEISLTTLSATQFVVAYDDTTDSGHGTAKVGTISGTAITFGAEAEFLSSANTPDLSANRTISVAALSEPLTFGPVTKFIVAYRTSFSDSTFRVRVGTVSGTDITFGAEVAQSAGGLVEYISAVVLSATRFVVTYEWFATEGRSHYGTISGTDITFGPQTTFFGPLSPVRGVTAAALSPTKFAVVWSADTITILLAKIGTVSPVASSLIATAAAYPPTIGATRLAFSSWSRL